MRSGRSPGRITFPSVTTRRNWHARPGLMAPYPTAMEAHQTGSRRGFSSDDTRGARAPRDDAAMFGRTQLGGSSGSARCECSVFARELAGGAVDVVDAEAAALQAGRELRGDAGPEVGVGFDSASISPRVSSQPCSENSVSVSNGARAKLRRSSSSVRRRPSRISTLRCDIGFQSFVPLSDSLPCALRLPAAAERAIDLDERRELVELRLRRARAPR